LKTDNDNLLDGIAQIDTQLEELTAKLAFSEETILRDVGQQPLLFMEAARLRMQAARKLGRLKMNLELAELSVGGRYRQQLESSGERVTEKRIEELVGQDGFVMAARTDYLDAKYRDELTDLVVEAFRQRRDCLRIVSVLVGSEISLQSSIEAGRRQLDRTRENLQKKYNA
jgi:hypothetical protein